MCYILRGVELAGDRFSGKCCEFHDFGLSLQDPHYRRCWASHPFEARGQSRHVRATILPCFLQDIVEGLDPQGYVASQVTDTTDLAIKQPKDTTSGT